jgi:hypothetical protein
LPLPKSPCGPGIGHAKMGPCNRRGGDCALKGHGTGCSHPGVPLHAEPDTTANFHSTALARENLVHRLAIIFCWSGHLEMSSPFFRFFRFGGFWGVCHCAALAPVIGFFVAFIFASIVFPLVVYICECMNGGPFKVGDTVQILTGPYRGRVTRIYSTWQGCTFRVQLGLEEQKTYKDIFCSDQLLCEENSAVET